MSNADCSCCAPPWSMKVAPNGAVAALTETTLSVLDLRGGLNWSVNALPNSAGTLQGTTGVCFGAGQDVWTGEWNNSGTFPNTIVKYLNHWSNTGTLLGSTTAYWTASFPARSLQSNASGQIASGGQATGNVLAWIDGVSCTSLGATSYGQVGIDDNGYVYALNRGAFGTTLDISRWDSSGNLIETLVSGMSASTNAAFGVFQDGSYLWVCQCVSSGGGTFNNTFKQLAIPGGAVLSTTTTNGTASPISSVRVSPWGTRYDLYGSRLDTDANLIYGNQVLTQAGVATINGTQFSNVGSTTSNAVSID